MIFESIEVNMITMKKIAFFLSVLFFFSACSSTKELSNRAENRKEKKLAEQVEIKKAVESRRFIIKVNRLLTTGGGVFELVPRSNFVIINGEIASVSLGYVGRSYFSRPISGINLNSHTKNYKMESNETKGIYQIEMELEYGGDKFEIFLTVGNSGLCNISLLNPNIQSVNYYGTLVPLPAEKAGQNGHTTI